MSQAITSPEIWIYTTDYKNSKKSRINVSAVECPVDQISRDKHWIFVFKSKSVTMYVDAHNKNGKLEKRFKYEEPEDVITKTKIRSVNATANDIHTLIDKSSVIGKTYGLNMCKVSCQSFVKELLKKLGVGPDLKIINDTPFGFFVESGKWSSEKVKGSFEYFFP
ncbi:UNVERIFIED_CONTAM: hypothetical protein RMT77_013045 [Armadillidium vulgare]